MVKKTLLQEYRLLFVIGDYSVVISSLTLERAFAFFVLWHHQRGRPEEPPPDGWGIDELRSASVTCETTRRLVRGRKPIGGFDI